jgi:hypothetical protein
MIRDIIPPRVEFNFTKGSLQDQSSNGYAATTTAGNGYWNKDEKARSLVFDGAATAIDLGNVSDFDNDEVQSFAAVFKTTSNAIQMIAIKSDGAVLFPGWALYISGGQIFFRIYQTTTATGFRISTDDTFNDGEVHSVVVTYGGLNGLDKGGAGTKIYVDNQLVDTTLAHDVAFTASTLNANDYRIGMASYGSLWFDGPLYYVAQFGAELTSQQANQLLTELNTTIPYTAVDFKSKDRYINAVADGMMKKSGTDDWIVDGVGGVLSKVSDPERGQVLAVYSGAGNITYAYQYNIGVGYYRLRGWLKGDATNGGIARIKVGGTWMTGSNATDDWQMIDEVLYNPSAANVPFKMGQTAATTSYSYYSDIECIKLNSNNENDFASPRAYIADGKGWNQSLANITTSGQIENTGFTLQSGHWKVNDEDGFNKNLTCVSNGLATRPSNQVYGTWEFDFKRTTDADVDYISIISDRIGATVEPIGYHLLVTDYGATQDTVALRRSTGVGATLLFVGEAGIITSGEWYKFRITRDASGVFKIYMKGATDADYVLLTASGGSNPVTDNTYTTCAHINLDLDTGNIRNFRFIPYIE